MSLPVQSSPLDVTGTWLTEDNKAKVSIYNCAGSPCGKIIWLEQASGLKDLNNPDKTLRARSILGLLILEGFKPGANSWLGGTVYDPESGKYYSARLTLKNSHTLKLQGCISIFCQTQVWKKADQL